MTDVVVEDGLFVRPDEIRCTTPARVNVAGTRLIYSTAEIEADHHHHHLEDEKEADSQAELTRDGDDDYYALSGDLPFADYDKIFSAALDLHLMEIIVPPPATIDHHNEHSMHHQHHHQMDSTPPPEFSNWTEDVRQAQTIIDQNVADMLAAKAARGGAGEPRTKNRKTPGPDKKKSFTVEFSSEQEYAQFLEFKNKLTASSCSSPSCDDEHCLASSLYASLYDTEGELEGEQLPLNTVSILPRGETESYHQFLSHHSAATPPSVSCSSLSTSDSSSYLATLSEVDEEEYEEDNLKLDAGLQLPSPTLSARQASAVAEAITTASEGLKDFTSGTGSRNPQTADDEDEGRDNRTWISLNGIDTGRGGESKAEEIRAPRAFRRACPSTSPSKQMQPLPVELESSGDTNRPDVKQTSEEAEQEPSANSISLKAAACPWSRRGFSEDEQVNGSVLNSSENSVGVEVGAKNPNKVPFVSIGDFYSTGIVPSTTTPAGPSSTSSPSSSSWRADQQHQVNSFSNSSSLCGATPVNCDSTQQCCSSLDCECELLNESSAGYYQVEVKVVVVEDEENLCTQDSVCEKSNSRLLCSQTHCDCCNNKLVGIVGVSGETSVVDSSTDKSCGLHNTDECCPCCCCCSCPKSFTVNNNNNIIIGRSNNSSGEDVGISNNDKEDSYDANVTFFSCCSDCDESGDPDTKDTSSIQRQVCDKTDTDNLIGIQANVESGLLQLHDGKTAANAENRLKGSFADTVRRRWHSDKSSGHDTSPSEVDEKRAKLCDNSAEADSFEGGINSPPSLTSKRDTTGSDYYLSAERVVDESVEFVSSDNNYSTSPTNLGLRPGSSTSSLNSSVSESSASFVASNRLKRLEERLRKFHYAKKLISDPADEEGRQSHDERDAPIQCSNNLLDVNASHDDVQEDHDAEERDVGDVSEDEQEKLISGITAELKETLFDQERNTDFSEQIKAQNGPLDKNNNNNKDNNTTIGCQGTYANAKRPVVDSLTRHRLHPQFGADYVDYDEEAVTRFGATPSPSPPPPADDELLDNNNNKTNTKRTCDSNSAEHLIYDSDDVSHCTFNVKSVATNYYPEPLSIDEECYDELIEDEQQLQLNCSEENCSCDCELDAFPVCYVNKAGARDRIRTVEDAMRESTGPLRGLLKKPNRPPQQRKNRVVFDETRNEFFDADYIILIREDCPYDEEDEEPCTCGEHELVRLCCEEGCQCPGYIEGDGKTPQSPKFAPPIEFVDQATLSPPEGYKDAAALSNALGGALGGHVFGAQHIQQLQVIQRLQQQRAAMLAARNSNNGVAASSSATAATAAAPNNNSATNSNNAPLAQGCNPPVAVAAASSCTECAACAECAANQDEDCQSPCPEELGGGVPHVAIVPMKATNSSQKEIIAGEERPKYFAANKIDNNQAYGTVSARLQPPLEPRMGGRGVAVTVMPTAPSQSSQRIIVETITMTTVTERRIVGGITDNRITHITASQPSSSADGASTAAAAEEEAPALPPKESHAAKAMLMMMNAEPPPDPGSLAGILKGGKMWKSETGEDTSNVTSDEETATNGGKRSVRFSEKVNQPLERDDNCDGNESEAQQIDDGSEVRPMEILPMKKHTSLFHNALRPNSAVRQLFPTGPAILTQEALRAFEESKRASVTATPAQQAETAAAAAAQAQSGNDSDTDTIRKTIERNALRRSLIKYEPKKPQKPLPKAETSLEERIRLLTCDIDDELNAGEEAGEGGHKDDMERRDSPAGEENPQQAKYMADKNYSPSSSASSSSSGSAYRKITDIFNKNSRQDKIPEGDENQSGIIPQSDCRCPAAPDLGIGLQMPQTHTQIHQTPPRQGESRRQFLSTLAPLTSCVAGQRDDMSYYTLSAAAGAVAGDRQSTASSHCSEYSLGDIEAVLDETKKVAPDVIAGTPGQETDELAAFAQQEASRTDRIKKRYSGESQQQPMQGGKSMPSSSSGAASDDDDEHNDYGFNKRPSVRGIKPRFGTTNEILQQMQAQLAQPGPMKVQAGAPVPNPPVGTVSATAAPSTPQVIQKVQTVVQQQQIATTAAVPGAAQHPGQWGYYPLGEQQHQHTLQRTQSGGQGVADVEFYGQLPAHVRHSFHGHHHEQATTLYQNCQGVTMHPHQHQAQQQQQHQHANAPYGHYARSPTRRPESPPPMKNYQTMVLIPYNTETYAHYTASANEHMPAVHGHQIRRLEYQQVTQQTIRVPMGFPLPGMQLHVMQAGRGTATTTTTNELHSNYSLPRLRPMNGNYEFVERGAPEGAAAASVQTTMDHKMPSAAGAIVPIQTGPQQPQIVGPNPAANVFYAMNV